MKRIIFLLSILFMVLMSALAVAGEIATLPSYINLHTPTTNKIELLSQNYYYGASPYLEIRYNVVDLDGSVIAEHLIKIEGSEFTTFVNGFGATMKSRGNTEILADVLSKYTVVE